MNISLSNKLIECQECGKKIKKSESFGGLCYNCDRLCRG